jgi:hypothetical protein
MSNLVGQPVSFVAQNLIFWWRLGEEDYYLDTRAGYRHGNFVLTAKAKHR